MSPQSLIGQSKFNALWFLSCLKYFRAMHSYVINGMIRIDPFFINIVGGVLNLMLEAGVMDLNGEWMFLVHLTYKTTFSGVGD